MGMINILAGCWSNQRLEEQSGVYLVSVYVFLALTFVPRQLRCFFFSRDANPSVDTSQIHAKQSVEVESTEASDQGAELTLHGIRSCCYDKLERGVGGGVF